MTSDNSLLPILRAEAISQGRTEAGISARLCRCAGGFNEQIFGADEQVPKRGQSD
jgi:hypothetical protein